MNCKKDDLAVVVRSRAGNLGKVVRCVRLATAADLHAADVTATGPVWVVDPPVMVLLPWTRQKRLVRLAPDECLRPLRDPGDDARDQTLDWLPVPKMSDIEELGLVVEKLRAIDRFRGEGN